MRSKLIFCLFILFFLLFSCQSINSNRAELGIPQKTVFFTFDDGPDEHTTAGLLDVLEKYQIKALFCLLGENAQQYPELVRRIHNEGHYIINHGFSDKWAVRMSDDEFRDNLIRGERAISTALGFDMNPKLYRPQGGFYNSRQEKICVNEGFIIVPVTIRVYDAVLTTAEREKVVKETVNMVKNQNGGMILLHDARDSHYRKETELAKNSNSPYNRSWIPETVEEIIISLLGMGFELNNAYFTD